MGATYLSIQASTTDQDSVLAFSRSFAERHPAEFQCYVGDPLGSWTAVYPSLSPVMDVFAKELSGARGCLVLTLASLDEDEVFCNFCQAGKDLGFFKITAGKRRSPKQREPVARKLSLLGAYLDPGQQANLVDYLSDTRQILFSGEILKAICQAVGIRNGSTSYSYIEHGDYQADLDVPVQLVKIG